MGENRSGVRRYKSLGARLKRQRENHQETLAEVSGAIEIDIESLEQLEAGSLRPAEDILLLLIHHFKIQDEEADAWWQLAGYEKTGEGVVDPEAISFTRPSASNIHYTDMVHVFANDYGVIIDFMQSLGAHGQPTIVSRLGMSKEHVESVIQVLQKSLEATEPKQLPSSQSKTSKK